MPVIAIVNRKGGSGKSTLATHIAAYCAHQGIGVMLGDVDRQQSTRSWLRLREQLHPLSKPILSWAVTQSSALRAPVGVSHVVLDTPGGLNGLDLARVVMFADVVLMPLCNSVFDRDSAAQCYEELKIFPRIASGRCKLAVVGMRVDSRAIDSAALELWATNRKLPFLGSLRNSPSYVQCIEQGITIFDLPKDNVSQDLAQWKPILDWLQPVLFPMPAIQDKTLNGSAAIYMGRNKALVERLQQPHPPLTAAGRDIGSRVSDESSQPATWGEPVSQEKKGDFIGSMGLPNFLRRK